MAMLLRLNAVLLMVVLLWSLQPSWCAGLNARMRLLLRYFTESESGTISTTSGFLRLSLPLELSRFNRTLEPGKMFRSEAVMSNVPHPDSGRQDDAQDQEKAGDGAGVG